MDFCQAYGVKGRFLGTRLDGDIGEMLANLDSVLSGPGNGLYDVPHGRAIATLLPPVMDYNRQAAPEKFAALEQVFRKELPDSNAQQNVAEMVSALARENGIPSKLSELGIANEQLDEILDDAMPRQNMQNNARNIDRNAAEQMLRTML